jgi:nucleotide-binding universal stress UspA family protein
MENLQSQYPNIDLNYLIYRSNPQTGIVKIAVQNNYDLIALGTTGLGALKNITIGSNTKYIIEHSKIPVLAIPEDVNEIRLGQPILAIDLFELPSELGITAFKMFFSSDIKKAKVVYASDRNEILQVKSRELATLLADLDYSLEVIQGNNLESAMFNYHSSGKNEVLCLFHKGKSWIRRLIEGSNSTKELNQLETPLLILPS